MKLQAAIDMKTIDEALKLMEKIHPYVDIVEVGTFLGLLEGFSALTKMKAAYPHKDVLSDAKIVDGGYGIGGAAFDAGADIVTTIGLTNDETLRGLVRAAHERNKKAMVDTIGVPNIRERVVQLDEMGFDYILLHTAHDMLVCDSAPTEDVKACKKLVKRALIGISGGITVEQMPEIVACDPDWVVVGSAINKSDDPLSVVKALRSYMP
ncbi:MAG: orotidine 5'-phosphate decarboxylase / HUMPS family protein [Clostridia bacterium]|nr:orotidine 5'-phosphate decarboxylase / HUMPS family protein [Clostridia bacterium]